MKKKIKKLLLGALILMALFLGSYLIYASFNPVQTEGYVRADFIEAEENLMAIGYNCTAVIGAITPERAEYIKAGKVGIIHDRPTIYDDFKETLNFFNITLEAVQIKSITDKNFISDIIFSKDKDVLAIDARPSDAVALALRTKSPIYINESLLKEVGKKVC